MREINIYKFRILFFSEFFVESQIHLVETFAYHQLKRLLSRKKNSSRERFLEKPSHFLLLSSFYALTCQSVLLCTLKGTVLELITPRANTFIVIKKLLNAINFLKTRQFLRISPLECAFARKEQREILPRARTYHANSCVKLCNCINPIHSVAIYYNGSTPVLLNPPCLGAEN